MKERWKDGCPVFLAILVFGAVEALLMLKLIPQKQWIDFVKMGNVILAVIAVFSFFLLGLPMKTADKRNLGSILGNIGVAAVAFLLDISASEDVMAEAADSLRNWRLFWIVCAVTQILFLSDLGERILYYIKEVLKWGGKLLHLFGSIITGFGEIIAGIPEDIRSCGKIERIIALIGIVLWGIYLGILIHIQGMPIVFSNTDIFWNSLSMWTAYIIICFLIYITGSFFAKAASEIRNGQGLKIIEVVIVLILSVILTCLLPALLKIMVIMFSTCLVLTGVPWLVIKYIKIRRKAKKLNSNKAAEDGNESCENNDFVTDMNIRLWDLIVVQISFIGFPLLIILFATALQPASQNIAAQDLTDISTWLNIINSVFEVTKNLLDLLI